MPMTLQDGERYNLCYKKPIAGGRGEGAWIQVGFVQVAKSGKGLTVIMNAMPLPGVFDGMMMAFPSEGAGGYGRPRRRRPLAPGPTRRPATSRLLLVTKTRRCEAAMITITSIKKALKQTVGYELWRKVRGRFIVSDMEAWDLGAYAHSWNLRWRFFLVRHDHDDPTNLPDGTGPWRLYFLCGNIESQFGEFIEMSCK